MTARHLLPLALLVGLSVFPFGEAEAGEPPAKGKPKIVRDEDLPYPPRLPNGAAAATDESPQLLVPPDTLREGVAIAKTAPRIDFVFYPEQNYPGKPWSNWGDGTVANGRFYSAVGDHIAINRGNADDRGTGTAFVYEYDPGKRTLRTLVDVAETLDLPEGHYTPGKIHSRVDMGRDGWLYFSTHRGSPRAANDENHYRGDWILRTNPATGVSEIVAHAPVPKHSIPASVLDPDRLVFYGATAAGPDADDQSINFLAFDVEARKPLYVGPNGPARAMMLARSTGRVYFVPGAGDGPLMRFDPQQGGPPTKVGITMGVRAATDETADGKIYAVGLGQRSEDATIWEFDTKTEKAREIGTVAVGPSAYVASIDVDPTGRYLYWVPGAHGSGPRDGSPIVQFDVRTGRKKVLAFLHPFYQEKYGFTPKGTYCTALSEDGSTLFVNWNVSRGTRAWDCCGLTAVHIPKSERP